MDTDTGRCTRDPLAEGGCLIPHRLRVLGLTQEHNHTYSTTLKRVLEDGISLLQAPIMAQDVDKYEASTLYRAGGSIVHRHE